MGAIVCPSALQALRQKFLTAKSDIEKKWRDYQARPRPRPHPPPPTAPPPPSPYPTSSRPTPPPPPHPPHWYCYQAELQKAANALEAPAR